MSIFSICSTPSHRSLERKSRSDLAHMVMNVMRGLPDDGEAIFPAEPTTKMLNEAVTMIVEAQEFGTQRFVEVKIGRTGLVSLYRRMLGAYQPRRHITPELQEQMRLAVIEKLMASGALRNVTRRGDTVSLMNLAGDIATDLGFPRP